MRKLRNNLAETMWKEWGPGIVAFSHSNGPGTPEAAKEAELFEAVFETVEAAYKSRLGPGAAARLTGEGHSKDVDSVRKMVDDCHPDTSLFALHGATLSGTPEEIELLQNRLVKKGQTLLCRGHFYGMAVERLERKDYQIPQFTALLGRKETAAGGAYLPVYGGRMCALSKKQRAPFAADVEAPAPAGKAAKMGGRGRNFGWLDASTLSAADKEKARKVVGSLRKLKAESPALSRPCTKVYKKLYYQVTKARQPNLKDCMAEAEALLKGGPHPVKEKGLREAAKGLFVVKSYLEKAAKALDRMLAEQEA